MIRPQLEDDVGGPSNLHRHIGKRKDEAARLESTIDGRCRGRELADPNADAVKQQLRANTEEALAAGAFGVPSFVVDDKLFWGLDGLPMLKACLEGDAWFDGPYWDSAASVQVGVRRLP